MKVSKAIEGGTKVALRTEKESSPYIKNWTNKMSCVDRSCRRFKISDSVNKEPLLTGTHCPPLAGNPRSHTVQNKNLLNLLQL